MSDPNRALLVDAEDFAGLEIADPASDRPVAAVVVGDYGARWTFDGLNGAFRRLMHASQPPLVALGMTRYWQAEDGLKLDTAATGVIRRRPLRAGRCASARASC